ncbi:MerR family transcriptional regulator [Muricoccus radiodurans]|uniref:MerR family transcriptional regulator n=1 Tax=Muricoccus radiodurans TaxID=2231721 RepID=UPI003CEC6730
MSVPAFSIGELGRRTGCKVQTIRWYEEVGLLPPASRTAGGHRVYGAAHLQRLDFVRHAREFGFSLDAIRTLLALSDHPERPCETVHALAVQQLASVEDKLRRLETLRGELARLTDACRGGPAGECQILETLADHSHGHCVSADHAPPGPGVVARDGVTSPRSGPGSMLVPSTFPPACRQRWQPVRTAQRHEWRMGKELW